MNTLNFKMAFLGLSLTFLTLFFSGDAFAATASGLPWEAPTETVARSLIFTIRWIAVIAFCVSVGVLLFGGELPDWGRRLVIIVLALSLVLGGISWFTTLFGSSGAVIDPSLIGSGCDF